MTIRYSDIFEAAKHGQKLVMETPLTYTRTFSELIGGTVFLKEENFQKTGSFKVRGAYNKIRQLTPAQKKKGVVAVSAGNHAQGVAFVATHFGVKSTIVMPEGTSFAKLAATKGYGGKVVLYGESFDDAGAKAKQIQQETGATLIHAYNDEQIVTGQGTLGLEILQQLPKPDVIVCPIGGGGLISGIALAVKTHHPNTKIIGVQMSGANAMYESVRKKRICSIPCHTSIADGIAIKSPGEVTYPIIRKYVDDIVLVNDEEVANAILMLLERSKLVAEGAGAVSLAALLAGKIKAENKNVVLVISGGNIDVNLLSLIIARGLVKAGRYLDVTVTVPDKPGQLKKILDVIATTQGNVITIFHERLKQSTPMGTTTIRVTLEARDAKHAGEIRQHLHRAGYVLE
jgi:threonine dehydratase